MSLKKRIGLYVGRFQPFHNGHPYAIQNILNEVDEVIIVIGSSQYAGLPTQPYSAKLRRRMIEETLRAKGITNYSIVEVPDIHNDAAWVEHLKKYVKNFDVVFTGNDHTKKLFEEKGIEVRAVRILPGVSGTLIRRLIHDKKKWQKFVSPQTAKIVQTSRGTNR